MDLICIQEAVYLCLGSDLDPGYPKLNVVLFFCFLVFKDSFLTYWDWDYYSE
jgi:hypothetical protein